MAVLLAALLSLAPGSIAYPTLQSDTDPSRVPAQETESHTPDNRPRHATMLADEEAVPRPPRLARVDRGQIADYWG